MIETRKLPKKTIIIISVIIFIALILMYILSTLKELKVKEYLERVGYKSVQNITVYNKSKVQDDKTKQKGYLFKIKFEDLNNKKICKGLIFIYNKKDIPKTDIDCK